MTRVALPRFTRGEILFSFKCFGAAMLAVWIASRAGLPRPFWSMLTTYVVAAPLAGSVPLAGAVRSKALFRFLGTLLGCIAVVAIVPALSNAPALCAFALASWVGLCLYLSLLDRTARSYVFMLAGYTAALIGFPSVTAPIGLFDNAVARVEEIGIGILCGSLVHSLVFPVSLGPTLLGVMDRSLADARRWFADVLRPLAAGDGTPKTLAIDRARLAGDITQLRLLSTHVPFDTSHLRWTAGAIGTMQDSLAALTPALSAVEDRLQALVDAEGALAPDITAVLAQTALWLHADTARTPPPDGAKVSPTAVRDRDAALKQLRESLRQLGDPGETGEDGNAAPPIAWCRALRIGLAVRLDELVAGWRACETLRRLIDAGLTGAAAPLRRTSAFSNRVLHKDTGLALLSAFAAMLAIGTCCAFWIYTGWPSGSAAAMMSAVFCCFFATMDDPVPGIRTFNKFTVLSVPISALYVLVLLPLVNDFGMFVLSTAPIFLLIGLYTGRPSTALPATAMIFGVAGTLSLHDTHSADFPAFFNSTLGQVIGVAVAAQVTAVVRSVGGDWTVQRIRRATWRELGQMAAASRNDPADDAYAVRMVDRIGLIAPRVAGAEAKVRDEAAQNALRDLRAGTDIVALQRVRRQLPSLGVGEFLRELAHLLRTRARGFKGEPPATLLARLDGVLSTVLARRDIGAAQPDDVRIAVTALVGLRRAVFPTAPAALTSSAPGAPA